MSIAIVTDSHSSITPEEARRLGVYLLPAPFFIDGVSYYENVDIGREDFFQLLKNSSNVSTSQSSPSEVMSIWDEALKDHDEILYMPISSGLSSSCANAKALAAEDPYKGRVFVVDNGRVSTPMHCTILDALNMIKKGISASVIRDILEKYRDEEIIYLAVDTLEYLKRGGYIFFEIGYDQKDAVLELLNKEGYKDVLCIKDLAGFDRVVKAWYAEQR